MIFENVHALQSSSFKPAVCIVGSGPAGISLALRLERWKIPCLIVEAGGFELESAVQDAYRGTVIGDAYYDLSIARLRYFGGTSGHWAGWCRALDDIDFEPRPGIDKSGWPIRKRDLDPYAVDANSILDIGPVAPDMRLNDSLSEVQVQVSAPTRFGLKYRKHVEGSSSIGLLLRSPVTAIVPVRGRIDLVKVRDATGAAHPIRAGMYCICTGGIENSRLLLWSNRLHGGGVVPNPATLGRYWMEHPHANVGEAVLYTFTGMRIKRGMRFYAPTPQFLQGQHIGNFAVRLLAGESLTKALIKDGLCHAPKLFEDLARKANAGLVCGANVRLAWEQLPLADNRIELDDAADAEGVARTKLFWRKGPVERRTAVTALRQFAGWLTEADRGRVRVASWLAEGKDYPDDPEKAGFHHMGGTRMASSAADGVVDANCKVFGVENLYIGGSSVFPTGGHANPTYTIVQLALRLGDHLAGRLKPAA